MWTKSALGRDPHRQCADAIDEVRIEALGLLQDLDALEAGQQLLPENTELQLCQPVADAAVDAEAEGQVLMRPRPVDDELIGPLDRVRVSVAGHVPQDDLVALADLLVA